MVTMNATPTAFGASCCKFSGQRLDTAKAQFGTAKDVVSNKASAVSTAAAEKWAAMSQRLKEGPIGSKFNRMA